MGDRWRSANLKRSTYIWLPLQLTGATDVWLTNRARWVPNVSARTWSAGPSEATIEAEAGTTSNGASAVSCSGCSGGKAVGYIGGSSGGTVTFSGVSSATAKRTTVRLQYANGDSNERYARVTVNGQSQTVAFLPTDNGQSVGTSVVNCNLNAGSSNTIAITGTGGSSYGPDLDQVLVSVN